MRKRSSGILMHISSLPSKYGIGNFGIEAYKFIDFLKKSKQSYWQVLPLGITSYGDSPYQSVSSFAGNPYFIDLDEFVKLEFITQEELDQYNPTTVDYGNLFETRYEVLRTIYKKNKSKIEKDLKEFYIQNNDWLRDFSLFMALKDHHNHVSVLDFEPKYKDYHSKEVLIFEKTHQEELFFWVFTQYYFNKQYTKLKNYANNQNIKIIGDLPIYCALDSVEVWSMPHLFKVDKDLNPSVVAGCPPDDFSSTGQLWGNPVYDWSNNKLEHYQFWINRVKHNFELFDTVRIDHFRGFDEYFEIDSISLDASAGTWAPGPGMELMNEIKNKLGKVDIIVEDLGYMTESVVELVKDSGYPNMKVLLFGIEANHDSEHLPHNYYRNMIAYSGTHDNETLWEWFEENKNHVSTTKYFNLQKDSKLNISIIRSLYQSPAYLVMIPIQDIIFDESVKRMNKPSSLIGNWQYRIKKEDLSDTLAQTLSDLVTTYYR